MNNIAEKKNLVKSTIEGASWGVGGAVPATSVVIGGDSPAPQGAPSFVQGVGRSQLGATAGGMGRTVGGAGGQSPPQDYKDYVDTSQKVSEQKPWPKCAIYFVPGQCSECGTNFTKVLMCGLEWCPDCGAVWSWIHKRRFLRVYGRAKQLEVMGYWVLEWPRASRYKLRSKDALRETSKKIKQIFSREGLYLIGPKKGQFKGLGYSRGIQRWHLFGSKSDKFNPHDNILTESGYISRKDLQRQKAFIRKQLGEPKLIINYSFGKDPAKKTHMIKYITRATFLNKSWDLELAANLWSWQNGSSWGVWKDVTAWELSKPLRDSLGKAHSLSKGFCPYCSEGKDEGVELKWGEALPIKLLTRFGVELDDLGAGYFEVICDRSPPPGLSDQVKKVLSELEFKHRAEVLVAQAWAEREAKVKAKAYQVWWWDLLNESYLN
ncbi:hypothetical protein ACFLVH_05280 [Chloroflexota bacterium]